MSTTDRKHRGEQAAPGHGGAAGATEPRPAASAYRARLLDPLALAAVPACMAATALLAPDQAALIMLAVVVLTLGLWDTLVIAFFVLIGAVIGQIRDGENGIVNFFGRLFSGR